MFEDSSMASRAPELTPQLASTAQRSRADIENDILTLEILPPHERLDAAKPADDLEAEAISFGAVDLMLRARLVRAVAVGRRGRIAASARIIRDIHRWATEENHDYLLARAERHMSHLNRLLGDYGAALEYAVLAFEHTSPDMPVQVRSDHSHVLAIAMARTGDYEGAVQRFTTMDLELSSGGHPHLRVSLLNNLAYVHFENGDLDTALATAERMMAISAAHGLPLLAAYVDTYARVMLSLGRPERALDLLDGTIDIDEDRYDVDSKADCLLTLAEARHAAGRKAQAHDALNRCERLCRRRDLMEILMRVRKERAELLASEARYREAYEEHKRYAELTATINSIERDGRAKIAAAVFETAEARRESERFRWLSQQDPLTRLYNRRFIDERLPQLLAETGAQGRACSVALLDLDHFKRVNDTYSHEKGDLVLMRVAELLSAGVGSQGTAARLGGEEFVLLMPGVGRREAVALCSRVLSHLREHAWSALVPGLNTVTASIGLVTCSKPSDRDPTAAMRTADMNLYRAKSAGRDRIIASATTHTLNLVGELPVQPSKPCLT